MTFYVWLLSLSIMFLRFIHIVLHSFLWMSNSPCFECTTISLLIDGCLNCFHFLVFVNSGAENIWTSVQIMLIIVNDYLDCFHFGAIMNNAAMNIHVQVFVWAYVWILLCTYLGVEMLGHMIILYSTFWGTAKLCSTAAVPFYIPTRNVWRF